MDGLQQGRQRKSPSLPLLNETNTRPYSRGYQTIPSHPIPSPALRERNSAERFSAMAMAMVCRCWTKKTSNGDGQERKFAVLRYL